jgi:hypothetical protein
LPDCQPVSAARASGTLKGKREICAQPQKIIKKMKMMEINSFLCIAIPILCPWHKFSLCTITFSVFATIVPMGLIS